MRDSRKASSRVCKWTTNWNSKKILHFLDLYNQHLFIGLSTTLEPPSMLNNFTLWKSVSEVSLTSIAWQISRRWAVWEHKEGPASGRASSNGKEFSPHPFKKFQYLSLLSGSCLSPTYLFPLSLPFWAFSLLLTLLDWIQFLNLASSHNVTPRSLMEIFFLFLNFSLTLSVLRLMLSVMPRGKFSLW